MAQTFKGTIYSFKNPPKSQFYQLEKNELLAMNLIGLPICVEHHSKPVGTIVAASMSDDSADVEWQLNDDASGWAAETLVTHGAARELSLKHRKNVDGSLTPLEVSLVLKGARPESSIHINTTPIPTLKETVVAASDSMAESAPAPVVPTEAAPAPVAPETTQPRDEAGKFTSIETAAPVATEQPPAKKLKIESGDDHMAFVQNLASKIQDKETLQSVIDYVGANMEHFVQTKAQMDTLMETKAALERAVETNKESSKNVVSDITKVLMQLYGSYAPHAKIDDGQRAEFVNHISSNPVALDVLKPLMVAASAIYDDQAKKEREAKNSEMQAQFAKLEALRSQMGTIKKMGAPVGMAAPPAVQPAWQMAAPAVTVAASSMQAPTDEMAMLKSMQLPPILAGLTAFQVRTVPGNCAKLAHSFFARAWPPFRTILTRLSEQGQIGRIGAKGNMF